MVALAIFQHPPPTSHITMCLYNVRISQAARLPGCLSRDLISSETSSGTVSSGTISSRVNFSGLIFYCISFGRLEPYLLCPCRGHAGKFEIEPRQRSRCS